jgi:RNA polymerase sigma-70 factor (ECF subfamily)
MRGAARARPAHDYAATKLRLLADLINDALVAMGTQPAFAGAGLVQQAAIETPTVGRRPSPLGGRRTRPLRSAPEPPSEPPTAEDEVEGDHVEMWRLVRLAQAGDGEAFGNLYDLYVDTVYRFIYFRVNDRALAEDFTSETFLRALRRIGTISYQGRDIGAWFITIARNIVLDHMKSARHRLEVTTADTIEGKEHAESTESAVLDTLATERLMAAVAMLGDEQRECVMLRFIHGLSVSETAAVMGKNDGAIKALQHRAVRKLADLVGGDLR